MRQKLLQLNEFGNVFHQRPVSRILHQSSSAGAAMKSLTSGFSNQDRMGVRRINLSRRNHINNVKQLKPLDPYAPKILGLSQSKPSDPYAPKVHDLSQSKPSDPYAPKVLDLSQSKPTDPYAQKELDLSPSKPTDPYAPKVLDLSPATPTDTYAPKVLDLSQSKPTDPYAPKVLDLSQSNPIDPYAPKVLDLSQSIVNENKNSVRQVIHSQITSNSKLKHRTFPVSLNLGRKYLNLQRLARKAAAKGDGVRSARRHRISIRTGKSAARNIRITHAFGSRGRARILIDTGVSYNNHGRFNKHMNTDIPKTDNRVATLSKQDNVDAVSHFNQGIGLNGTRMETSQINLSESANLTESSVLNNNTIVQNINSTKLIEDINSSIHLPPKMENATNVTAQTQIKSNSNKNTKLTQKMEHATTAVTQGGMTNLTRKSKGSIISIEKGNVQASNNLHNRSKNKHSVNTTETVKVLTAVLKSHSSNGSNGGTGNGKQLTVIHTDEDKDTPDGPDGPDTPDGNDGPDFK